MNKVKIQTFVSVMFILFGLTAVAQAEVVLKITHCLPTTHNQVETYFAGFHNPFNERNKGEVRLHLLGGPEVTPHKKQGPSLKRGLVDMIFCPMGYYEGMLPEAGLTSVTNLSTKQLRENGAIDMLQPAWIDKLNGKILGWCCYGVDFHIYTTFKPKVSDKTGLDLSGYKMRSTATYNPFFKAMGATPINMSAGELYTGLQRGVVQGFAWPEGALASMGIQKFIKYRVYPGFFRSGSMVLINNDKFNSLSKSVQEKLVEAGLAFEQGSEPILRETADNDNKKLFAAGMQKFELQGQPRKAYLKTIYEGGWERRKNNKFQIPYAKLKEKMLYVEP